MLTEVKKLRKGGGGGLRGRKEMWVSQKLVASLPQTIKVSWMCPWDETTTFHEPFHNQSENQNWSPVFHIIKHKEIEVFELWKDWSSFSSNWASFFFSSEWLLSKNVRSLYSSSTQSVSKFHPLELCQPFIKLINSNFLMTK